jgi:hypothetical protein
MLPSYVLVVRITAGEKKISGKQFREKVASCLAYLDALKGSLRPGPCSKVYYPPAKQNDSAEQEYWSVVATIILSVGQQRAQSLIILYQAIVLLIELELPLFQVQAEIEVLNYA